jgi:hypothetical protein
MSSIYMQCRVTKFIRKFLWCNIAAILQEYCRNIAGLLQDYFGIIARLFRAGFLGKKKPAQGGLIFNYSSDASIRGTSLQYGHSGCPY